MIKAVLFDLDNTLILFDETAFYQQYLANITRAFQGLMPMHIFQKRLMSASQALLQNSGKMLNSEFYMSVFAEGFAQKSEAMWQKFIDFYQQDFNRLQSLMIPVPGVHELFNYLRQTELKIVVASNPLFPLTAQLKRLSWAGLADYPFDLITHLENTTFCKPQTGYYREICRQIRVDPHDCLMAGNDDVNDMIAGKTGMKTYLTTDSRLIGEASLAVSKNLRDSEVEETVKIEYRGSLSGVKKVLENL
ncbi:MAG TPA: HAD family hydrolase [Bacteroidetes bacterium]|nr:HAD family hydrolase [Bacteroidota bacterium]